MDRLNSRLDMHGGVYRRLYATKLQQGKRINSVSMEAEAWFWRLHTLADDFGVFPADPAVCRNLAAPRRPRLRDAEVHGWLSDLANAGLIRLYTVRDESYGVILHWEENQPANKNGRRISRYPFLDPDTLELTHHAGNPGESGGIQEIQALREQEQEQEQERIPPKPPKGGSVHKVESWMLRFGEAWKARYGGNLLYAKHAKPLRALVNEHGEAETLRRFKIYIAKTPGKFVNLHTFAATFGEWATERGVDGAAPDPAEFFK